MSENEQLSFEFEERPTIKGFPELRWTGKRPYRSTQYYPAHKKKRPVHLIASPPRILLF